MKWALFYIWNEADEPETYPRSGQIWWGLSMNGGEGFTSIRGGWIPESTHPDIPFCSFWLSIILCPCQCHIQTILSSSCFFIFLGAAPITSGQFSLAGGRMLTARDGAYGNQGPPISGVHGGWVKGWGLYAILQGAVTWPEPLTSVVPPPPKRHRWVPTAMVSHPTAQEVKAAALGALEQGAPCLSSNPYGVTYPQWWHPYIST